MHEWISIPDKPAVISNLLATQTCGMLTLVLLFNSGLGELLPEQGAEFVWLSPTRLFILCETLCQAEPPNPVTRLLPFQSAVLVLSRISISVRNDDRLECHGVPHNRLADPTMMAALTVSF